MKLYEAYKLAIENGMAHDPRPKEEIELVLKNAAKAYKDLSEDCKPYFDQERLWNPYQDSRFTWGAELAQDLDVQRLMWGIDIGTGELLLADRLREKGQRIDAVVAHHPTGRSRVPFPEVMWMQTDIYHDCGVPINVAESLMKPRMDQVSLDVLGSNYNQAADAARLLDIPMMNLHSPADNLVQEYLEQKVAAAEPKHLSDLIDLLMKEPEYQQASRLNDPPQIIVGSKDSRCGKVIAKMTGGTSGPQGIYHELALAGVGTVIAMHMSSEHVEACKKEHLNVIISGHMASDSVGINLMCDMWQKHGIEVFGAAGFTRFSRN